MKRFLITGLATLLPTVLMLYLLYIILLAIHEHIGRKFNALFGIPQGSWQIFLGDAVALLILMFLVWAVGFFVATYLGKLFFRWLDSVYRRIPLIRLVYPAVKQVTDFFLEKRAVQFSRVVAVEYPRTGIYAIGFVTGDGLSQLISEDGERLITVFVPSSPTPFTGYTTFVRKSEIISLDLSVDEAVKLIVMPDRELLAPQRAGGLSAGPEAHDALPPGEARS